MDSRDNRQHRIRHQQVAPFYSGAMARIYSGVDTLHAGAGGGVESPRRAQGIRLDAGDLVLHLLAEARKGVVAEDVEARHHVDQAPDVLDHRIAEDQRLALVVLAQPLADPLDRLAETPV